MNNANNNSIVHDPKGRITILSNFHVYRKCTFFVLFDMTRWAKILPTWSEKRRLRAQIRVQRKVKKDVMGGSASGICLEIKEKTLEGM